MKKQAKSVAVLLAAAILTVGAAMTSLAASGWAEENGGWIYIGEDGKKAAGELLEIDRNYYYFDENGVNVKNQWVAFENEDSDEEDQPERYWYYFQENGKACKRSDSASSDAAYINTIDEKKYTFDTEGRMLYGWVSEGEQQSGEDAWKTCDYYFGGEDDGAMRVAWERITITDDNTEKVQPGDNFWEEEQGRWFYFSGTGRKIKGKENDCIRKTIDGNKYRFDEFGRMIVSWYADPRIITTELAKGVDSYESSTAQGGKKYTNQFMYFGSPESGAQYTQGWFKAVPSLYLMAQKHLEEDPGLYFADEKGYICANEIRTIDGEKYAFDNYGRQISGFVNLTMTSGSTSKNFNKKAYSDDSKNPFSTEEEYETLINNFAQEFYSHEMRFYLFSGPDNSMLTGNQKVTIGLDQFDFRFETEGSLKGSGVMGKKDGKLYLAGKLLKPEEGEKYAIYKQELNNYGVFSKLSVEAFIDENCDYGVYDEKKDRTVWKAMEPPDNVNYYLVDAAGNIVRNKTNAKNIDGYEISVKDHEIKSITVR